jgi:DNA repair exonuclease SbcCD ATPase subunit
MYKKKSLASQIFVAIFLVQLGACVPYSDYERKQEALDFTVEMLKSVKKENAELKIKVEKLNSMILFIEQNQVNKALWIMECSRFTLTNSRLIPCNFSEQEVGAAKQLLAKPVMQSWITNLYKLGFFWVLFVAFLLPPLMFVACFMLVLARYLGKCFAPAFLYQHVASYRKEVDAGWQMHVEEQELRKSEIEKKHQVATEKLAEKEKTLQKLIRAYKLEIADLKEQIRDLTDQRDDLISEYEKAYSDLEVLNSKRETLKEDVSAQVNLIANDEILRRARRIQDLKLVDLKLGKS